MATAALRLSDRQGFTEIYVKMRNLPIVKKEDSSEWQHEAIHRRRGPKPGYVAARV